MREDRKLKPSPGQVAALSLIPGLGHWIIGERWRAGAFCLADVGIVVSIFFLKSAWGYALVFAAYLMAMIPAVIEAHALAQKGEAWFSQSKPYIITMLLLTGSAALPLLWQSTVFTKKNKIAGTSTVFVLAVLKTLFFGCIVVWIWRHIQR